MSPFKRTESRQSGMTLIELVVVLALLAGLAAMTLTGVGDLGNRARYDETTARMKQIRLAIVGDGADVGRFVRDMGRFPIVHTDADGVRLEELWRDPGAIGYGTVSRDLSAGPWQWPEWATFGGHLPPTVALTCGWNGPYLLVNDPDTAAFYDGFGNFWRVEGSAVGAVITNLTSVGSDDARGGSTWDESDRTLDFGALTPTTELTVLIRARTSNHPHDSAWRAVEAVGATVVGTNALPYQLHKIHVALFTPAVGAATADTNRLLLPLMATDVSGSVTFFDLMPSECRVYAYGYRGDPADPTSLQTSGRELEPVILKPGRNTITLYVREP